MTLARALTCVVVLGAAWAAPRAHAQVFSPGALSKAHKDIDGLTGCTKCHPEGGQHDNGRCLECHKEIDKRISASRGYHNTVRNQLCAECHTEHKGLAAKIIEWEPSRDLFNHGRTGWPLTGSHKKNKCTDCHDNKRVVEDDIRQILTKNNRETTFLGLSTRCVSCHFDEHRGQEGNDCARCHTTDEWLKAPGFDHNDRNDAKFPLQGKHKKVNCKGCHELLIDSKKYDGFLVPKSEYYMQYKDIPHASCVDCHEDYHKGAFGQNCVKCHTPEGFRIIKEGAKDTAFHDKHAFKLRGAHMSVDCKACHGPFGNQPAVFKGVKFKNCTDCHMDAHVGQIAAKDGVLRCDDCHNVNGFSPVIYDLPRHQQTRFPLDGAHEATACNACHTRDKTLQARLSKAAAKELERQKRAIVMSDTILNFPKAFSPEGKPNRCEVCHADDDPHAGQFTVIPKELAAAGLKQRSCAECHATTAFLDKSVFNHDESRFALTGKHAQLNCNECHFEAPAKGKQKSYVTYRPLPFQCQECHADTHVGQLAKADGITDCATCHATSDFKNLTFDHDKQSAFALNGAHEQTECKACHPAVDVGGTAIARYKPLPQKCEECHEDEHKGTFDNYAPHLNALGADDSALIALTLPHDATAAAPAQLPDAGVALTADAGVVGVMDGGLALPNDGGPDAVAAAVPTVPIGRCNGCHEEQGWWPAQFAHDRTSFPLTGRHQGLTCASCHQADYERSISPTCISCHRDPHVQEFGTNCAACHTTTDFRGPDFPVDAHRRLNFPLTGRHAALPCDECHVEKRDRTYTRAALDCAACHAGDARQATLTTVDHGRAPFTRGSCRDCHAPTTFKPATFVQHDVCFPITRGKHAPVTCNQCHTGLRGQAFNGDCAGVPVKCADCHTHRAQVEDRRHANVGGYEHKSEKCIVCHRVP